MSKDQTELSKAVKILVKALNSDEDYRRSWQANIAMAFKDEFNRDVKPEGRTIHQIANVAAINFLNTLTRDGK